MTYLAEKTVLILGAGGFIGRSLSERLAAQGLFVLAATRQPSSFSHPLIENVVAPYDTADHFKSLVAKASVVIHAASTSTPASSAAQPQLDGNLRATLALIESLQIPNPPRLLYLSSGGTLYGDCAEPANERAPLRPRAYHAAGKVAAEAFIHAWTEQYGGTAVILRPSNVYGPGQAPREGFGAIPTAMTCALEGIPFTIWGNGTSVRDYLYIDDLLELCEAAMGSVLPHGHHIFNAAQGVGTSLNALLDAIDQTTGRPLLRDYQPARGVDLHRIALQTTAARKAFGWQATTTLCEGLQSTWQQVWRLP